MAVGLTPGWRCVPAGGRMLRFRWVVVAALSFACHRAADVSGLYANGPASPRGEASGAFFPCDQPKTMWRISDSLLAERSRGIAAQPNQLLFARLRGVRSDSGSIYGGSHYFRVTQILELRARRPGECPVVDSVSQVVGGGARQP